ncbi:DMT family transporter [Pseudomonas sp. H3(2019)]|nr:DMT family transporter [Pseudomonas sp. H3(2019)]
MKAAFQTSEWITEGRGYTVVTSLYRGRSLMAGHIQPTQLRQASSSFGQGVLLCLLATAAWGSLFPVMTAALRMLDPFTFTTLRFAIAGSLFALLLLLREGRSAFSLKGQRVGLVWFLGTLGFAGFGLLVFIGQHLAGVQGTLIASVMMATQPMLSLLANWAIHRVRPSPWSCGFLLLSFCGVLLVVTSGHMGSASWSFEHAGGPWSLLAEYCAGSCIRLGAPCFPAGRHIVTPR